MKLKEAENKNNSKNQKTKFDKTSSVSASTKQFHEIEKLLEETSF